MYRDYSSSVSKISMLFSLQPCFYYS